MVGLLNVRLRARKFEEKWAIFFFFFGWVDIRNICICIFFVVGLMLLSEKCYFLKVFLWVSSLIFRQILNLDWRYEQWLLFSLILFDRFSRVARSSFPLKVSCFK